MSWSRLRWIVLLTLCTIVLVGCTSGGSTSSNDNSSTRKMPKPLMPGVIYNGSNNSGLIVFSSTATPREIDSATSAYCYNGYGIASATDGNKLLVWCNE